MDGNAKKKASPCVSVRIGLPGEAPLQIPDRLHELVAVRVAALSDSTREVMLAVAMLSRPSPSVLAAAFDSPQDVRAALAEASDADVVVDDGAGVRFTHPLLASAVYSSVSEERRRGMHRRLADVVSDLEERARHTARAATAPDEPTAPRPGPTL